MQSKAEMIELLDALAVTAELTGTELSEPAARMMVSDLSHYPLRQVLGALTRCRRELKGRLTVASIIERLDDGRPTPNEAWAMIPQDEEGSVVWTDEMAVAYGIAAPLLREGQHISARMAFLETYGNLVATARSESLPVRWTPSLGHDPTLRAATLEDAVRRGRLTVAHVAGLLADKSTDQGVLAALEDKSRKAGSPMPAKVWQQLAGLKLLKGGK